MQQLRSNQDVLVRIDVCTVIYMVIYTVWDIRWCMCLCVCAGGWQMVGCSGGRQTRVGVGPVSLASDIAVILYSSRLWV